MTVPKSGLGPGPIMLPGGPKSGLGPGPIMLPGGPKSGLGPGPIMLPGGPRLAGGPPCGPNPSRLSYNTLIQSIMNYTSID